MANCKYCGRPTGFLREHHAECSSQHDRAVTMIPGFFGKIEDSSLPLERFSELLQNAANASFIKPEHLKSLATDGMMKSIDKILSKRLPTEIEEQRMEDITCALGERLLDQPRIEERLIKVSILRELADRRMPDRIAVDGPMPIEFRRGERIIWIFNQVTSYQHQNVKMADLVAAKPDKVVDDAKQAISLPAAQETYCGTGAFEDEIMPTRAKLKKSIGDLVLTNHNAYLLFKDDLPRRIPMVRVSAVQAYSNGARIYWGGATQQSSTILLDDPWFFVNAIIGVTSRFERLRANKPSPANDRNLNDKSQD